MQSRLHQQVLRREQVLGDDAQRFVQGNLASVAAAVAKNGSLTAYAAEASQLGACAATLLLLLVAGVRAALRGGAVRAAQAARAGEPARHLNG